MLAELDAFVAAWLASRSFFKMLRLYSFTVWAVIVIVIHVSMFGRIFL